MVKTSRESMTNKDNYVNSRYVVKRARIVHVHCTHCSSPARRTVVLDIDALTCSHVPVRTPFVHRGRFTEKGARLALRRVGASAGLSGGLTLYEEWLEPRGWSRRREGGLLSEWR